MKTRMGKWSLLFAGLFLPSCLFAAEPSVPADTSVPLAAEVATPSDSENEQVAPHGLNEEQKKALEAKRMERRLALERRLEELKQLSKSEKDRRKAELREERRSRKEVRQERRMDNPLRIEQKRERPE